MKTIMVPVEPTQKMIEAAFYAYMDYEKLGPNKPAWNARSMWATMLLTWENEAAKEQAK